MSLPQPRADLGLRPGYHSAQVDAEVRLNTNESPYPPPAAWLEAWTAATAELPFNRYPDRAALGLREAIAELHATTPERVFAANGSNEVIQAVCLAYGGAGRAAVTFEPTYALHGHIAHLTGTDVHAAGRRADFAVDRDEARRVLAEVRPAVTFLCSPNNPTGTAEDPSLVADVVGSAPGLVVVDEAYGQFAEWSAAGLLADDVPLVVVRTFSKTWSMAALRLGYLLGPPEVVATLERVALPYHLDAAKQLAGRLAVGFAGDMRERVEALVAERRRLAAALAELPVQVWPSQANFLLFRPDSGEASTVWQRLVERSVLIRDASGWPGLDGCLRVTVGTPAEDDRFLAALTEVLA